MGEGGGGGGVGEGAKKLPSGINSALVTTDESYGVWFF